MSAQNRVVFDGKILPSIVELLQNRALEKYRKEHPEAGGISRDDQSLGFLDQEVAKLIGVCDVTAGNWRRRAAKDPVHAQSTIPVIHAIVASNNREIDDICNRAIERYRLAEENSKPTCLKFWTKLSSEEAEKKYAAITATYHESELERSRISELDKQLAQAQERVKSLAGELQKYR